MATKKTATKKTTSPVEQLSTRFRVKWGIDDDDYLSDFYDFWVEKSGNVRVDELYFDNAKQGAKVLRDMAQFLESYTDKMQGK